MWAIIGVGSMEELPVPSGILPVNAHAVNILKLKYIYSFILYSSNNRWSNDIVLLITEVHVATV